MKKLISVFAVLAMVGSLAAQKKPAAPKAPKAPAAPAAPAVAAPAAPAAPAMAAAPAKSGKGMGLSVEAYGLFTQTYISETATVDDQTGTSRKAELSNINGFGGGGSVGFDLVNNLSIQGSFDFRSGASREAKVNTGTVTNTSKTTVNTMWIGLGLRPRVAMGPGFLYAGAGAALVLPLKSTRTSKTTNNTSGAVTADTETIDNYGMGFGGYGEIGYQFNVTDMIFIGIGGRMLIASVNNDNRSQDVHNKLASSTSTTHYGSSYNTTDTPARSPYETRAITDISATVTVGARF